ncbi:MAG: isoprenylcysteine carboxylmethyltransferase family protein [Caldilineaceae bacterium]|nr:isoprenylcysteine carboxylmethyltransferase family protein [Caldilineaceae bacterium]
MDNLLVKAFAGLAFLLVMLAVAIFLPAGSLRFWQAWLYLADFALCTLLVTLYLIRYDQQLLASRVQAGPIAETEKSQQIIQSLASLFFLAVYVVAGLDFRFGWSNVTPVMSLLADGFVALGFLIVFLVFRENSYTSGTIEVAENQQVVTTGPYRVVRHPMYAGAFLLLLFTPLALGSWVALPLLIPLILVIAFRAVEEEKFLSANLDGYEAYKQRVHSRIIPFIW